MVTRTTGAIAICPTGNPQSSYYFYSLATSHQLNWNRWTQLPMPAKVIDHLHVLARQGNSPTGLSFADRNGNNPVDITYDSEDKPYNLADDANDEDNDDTLLPDNITGVNNDDETNVE
jgi:hypothetical protein